MGVYPLHCGRLTALPTPAHWVQYPHRLCQMLSWHGAELASTLRVLVTVLLLLAEALWLAISEGNSQSVRSVVDPFRGTYVITKF